MSETCQQIGQAALVTKLAKENLVKVPGYWRKDFVEGQTEWISS